MRNSLGQFKKGHPKIFFQHSEETCKKMSENSKKDKRKISNLLKNGQKTRFKKGIIPWIKGKHIKLTKEQSQKQFLNLPRGGKHHNWKGGISTEHDKIRSSVEFNLWHKSVFSRDNFTCQKTGLRGGNLVAHHINNFADFPELRLAIDNGITLSKESHIEFHKKYGRKNNTKEQIEEFLECAYTNGSYKKYPSKIA